MLRRQHLHRVESATASIAGYIYRAARRHQARVFRSLIRELRRAIVLPSGAVVLYRAETADFGASQVQLDAAVEAAVETAISGAMATSRRAAGISVAWLDPADKRQFTAVLTRRLTAALIASYRGSAQAALHRVLALMVTGESQQGIYRALVREFGVRYYTAERTTRTAINAAANSSALTDIITAGYTAKQWVATHDHRVRGFRKNDTHDHLHIDGRTVPVSRPFRDPRSGDEVMYPGDEALGASYGMIVNCRCTIIGAEVESAAPPAETSEASENPLPGYGTLRIDKTPVEQLKNELYSLYRRYMDKEAAERNSLRWSDEVADILYGKGWYAQAKSSFLKRWENTIIVHHSVFSEDAAKNPRLQGIQRALIFFDTLIGGQWFSRNEPGPNRRYYALRVDIAGSLISRLRGWFDAKQRPPVIGVLGGAVWQRTQFNTTIHELGHYLEFEWTGLTDYWADMVKKKGKAIKPLRFIHSGYGKEEIYATGVFRNAYAAKIYQPMWNMWYGNPVITEFISVGMGIFDRYKFRETFAEDPEYLEAFLRALKDLRAGRVRRPKGNILTKAEHDQQTELWNDAVRGLEDER